MVVEHSGDIKFYDAKGYETSEWSLKRQQVLDAYGIIIHLI